MSFSETVRSSSVNISHITLHSSSNNSVSSYTFVSGQPQPADAPVITVQLSTTDLNAVKKNDDVVTSRNNSYLSWTQFAATDMSTANNQVIPRATTEALQVQNLTPDTANPNLEQFRLDLNAGQVFLTFSEVVRANTFSIPALDLRNRANQSTQSYKLTSGRASTIDSTTVTLWLSETDSNAIKFYRYLAVSQDTTYIANDNTLVDDTNSNPVNPILPTEALQASSVTPDTTSPLLRQFSTDMTALELSLTFSETVQWMSLQPTLITLQNSRRSATQSVTLTGGLVSPLDSTVVTVSFTESDSNELKRLSQLATSTSDTFISFPQTMVRDMNNNNVTAISANSAQGVDNHTQDSIRPTLLRFNLDMDSALIHLTFSETVNASSFSTSALTIQGLKGTPSEHVTLNGGLWVKTDSTIISLRLTHSDDNAVKALRRLAKTAANTYVSLTTQLVRDMNGNSIVAIDRNDSQRVMVYTADTTQPQVTSFSLDLNTGQLFISFSETVDITTFHPPSVSIQNSDVVHPNLTRVWLTTERAYPTESDTMTVNLTKATWDSVRIHRNLATSLADTYIFVLNTTVQDMALVSNYLVQEIPQASNLTHDVTRPKLVYWEANLAGEASTLWLSFDEPVETSSFKATSIVLQAARDASTSRPLYRLTGGGTTSDDGLFLVVDLTTYDLNMIKKSTALLVDISTSFISLDSTMVDDMNANEIEPIARSEGVQASVYYNDTTRPVLRQFHLDMNANQLTLVFVETMNASSVNMSGITLQSSMDRSAGNAHRLQAGRVLSTDSTIITMEMTIADVNELKRLGIGRERSSSFVVLDSETIRDMNQHPLRTVTNSTRPLAVTNYTADSTRPKITGWNVDLTTERVWLTFDETVRASTLLAPEISVQTVTNASHQGFNDFTFTGDSLAISPPHTVVTMAIGTLDLNQIKRQSSLLIHINSSYLRLTSNAIQDMFGNDVVEVVSHSAIQVSTSIN